VLKTLNGDILHYSSCFRNKRHWYHCCNFVT